MSEAALPPDLRVALVHDWLTGMRGGEKVLEALCELFPAADLYTLLHVRGSVSATIESRRIRTSPLQRLPAAARSYRWTLPLMPAAIESFGRLRGYDLVLSSSHCVAKSIRCAPGTLAACYCHTPMRYVWDRFDDYFGAKPLPLRLAIGAAAAALRRWDAATASRVGLWLANSTVVKQRIVQYYGVPPERVEILHPPVEVDVFAGAAALPAPPGLAPGGYDLVVSALVAYKRIDLAVAAARRSGRLLVVVGEGPEAGRLRRLAAQVAGPGEVRFAGALAAGALASHYAHCRCFVFPGLEDFGITPLEATASGRPVVAYRAGGALDTVREGLNGIFFAEQTVESLVAALADPRLDGPWDGAAMCEHARRFDRARFRREAARRLGLAWASHRSSAAGRPAARHAAGSRP